MPPVIFAQNLQSQLDRLIPSGVGAPAATSPQALYGALRAQNDGSAANSQADVATHIILVKALSDPETLLLIQAHLGKVAAPGNPTLGKDAAKKLAGLAAAQSEQSRAQLKRYSQELGGVLSDALAGKTDAFSRFFDGSIPYPGQTPAVGEAAIPGEGRGKINMALTKPPSLLSQPTTKAQLLQRKQELTQRLVDLREMPSPPNWIENELRLTDRGLRSVNRQLAGYESNAAPRALAPAAFRMSVLAVLGGLMALGGLHERALMALGLLIGGGALLALARPLVKKYYLQNHWEGAQAEEFIRESESLLGYSLKQIMSIVLLMGGIAVTGKGLLMLLQLLTRH